MKQPENLKIYRNMYNKTKNLENLRNVITIAPVTWLIHD